MAAVFPDVPFQHGALGQEEEGASAACEWRLVVHGFPVLCVGGGMSAVVMRSVGGAVTALSGTACRQETGRVRRGAPQRDGPTGGQRERSAAGRRGSPPPQVRRGDRGGGPFPHNANYPGAFHAMGKL
ncbi:hypothetical protein DESPIGER_0256 [Desulfovibrio piger]|uniref:Uncharacterized protein n=1 Tax=Desulfovibrio piger TaxID=901 RepID=A0A1K1LBR8_9BACT|nr:hypothetical protein DESPIGER_0256 [Desulfovibrio piger]